MTGAQVISMGTNGCPVAGNGASGAQTFFDKLAERFALVRGINRGNGSLYANASPAGAS